MEYFVDFNKTSDASIILWTSEDVKMSDAERAEILKAKELESKQMVSNITTKTKRYRDIISFRKIQDKVNNRETEY